MHIPDCSEDSVEVESGGFADVSQGMYKGRRVAIKVVRMYITSDLDTIRRVSVYLCYCDHLNKWITAILPRGCRLETPPASKYPTTARSFTEQTPACSGF